MIVDSHCHLADAVFADDLAAVVSRAEAAGVTGVLTIVSADEPDEVARVPIVRAAWPAVTFAAGVHPQRAGAFAGRAAEAAQTTSDVASAIDAVAIGEIGLDYHYDLAPRDVQREVFAGQVACAVRRDRPVIIHTREAFDDTVAILREAGPAVRGVMHCFTGTMDEARRALDLGFFLSLSGILTFPKAGSLRDVAAYTPLDRVLIETDAPFLAPVPHRGRRNEPAWIVRTLEALAAIRGVTPERLAVAVAENFERFAGTSASGRLSAR
jgi:TatD DNase family protein